MLSLMCNQGLERCFQSQESEAAAAATLDRPTAVRAMDPIPPLPSDEPPRVKLLCSFGGSIIPRPHDGKLRYVGGDTRIVSLPRDVGFDELMLRMREIFEGVTALKYQQPDEELDALVSVVNDDDVTNMMEEYDKLGADGLNKLRIFLFSGFDNEVIHFDIDDRETERRYVDALNSLSDLSGVENNVALTPDQFMPPTALPPLNLHRLNAPHPSAGSNIYQQGHTPVHGHADMSLPWSPAYISSGHLTPHEARPDFPGSPSSCCCVALGDPHDRMPEDHPSQHVNHLYEYHQPNYADNVVWLPNGVVASSKPGYPNNVGNSYNNNNHNVYEGSCSCENCRLAFSRQSDMRWRQGQHHMEHPSSLNEFVPFTNRCADCIHGRDVYSLTPENDNQQFSNDPPNYERGWTAHHHHLEEPRTVASGIGRLREHYTDGNGRSYILDGHSLNSNCFLHDDCRQIRPCNDLAHERFREQAVISGPHMHAYEHTVGSVSPVQGAGVEDSGLRYGNIPTNYGMDSHYHVPQGPNFVNAYRRKVQSPVYGGSSCEASNVISQSEGQLHPGTTWVLQEGSPRFISTAQDLQKMFVHDGLAICTSSAQLQGPSDQFHIPPDNQGIAISCATSIISDKEDISSVSSNQIKSKNGSESMEPIRSLGEKQKLSGNHEEEHVGKLDAMNSHDTQKSPSLIKMHEQRFDLNGETVPDHSPSVQPADQFDYNLPLKEEERSMRNLSFLPDLIASVKRAALEEVNDVKVGAHENDCLSESMKKSFHQLEPVNGEVAVAKESLDDNTNVSKIEPTKAEAEALSRGLQTIKNNDLEEIRELGSGTYGAVYHGKWKGSDVAIKRIKASCFSGRPSERDRLIADFWKEALLLSSLHHPNVVSFYGIVRDGPDGSLATVTEFMVNGSLKQFLQKKDRTIDRRKRLIIAMDAAFGMEYLHGKNIVHFDLKCENLLVNMRDPQRPVCKIGDLGLSKVRQHTLVSGGVRGTLPWMAPELLSGKSNMVTEKIDVYSFGVVMWELLTGEEPYADMRCAAIIGGIVNNTLRPEIPQWCDPEWRSLIESCWASDPAERPSFAEISQKLRKMAAAMNVK